MVDLKQARQEYIERLADEVVLPVMKEYPGDRLTLPEITRLLHEHEDVIEAETYIEEALCYLEAGGEVISLMQPDYAMVRRWVYPAQESAG